MAQAADCGSVHEGSIPSGHPNYAGVVQRIEHFGPNEEMPVRPRPPVPVFVGVAPFDSSRSLQIFDIRGLGKRINPLGLGPRESRFKSEVPDQVLWGSQVVRRLAVNQFMRRFESCPHSQYAGVAFWLRAPLLQRGAVEFDPLPRYQASRSDFAPVAEGI